MATVHHRLGIAVVALGIVGALWAATCVRRRRVDPGLRTYLLLTEGVIVVQALLGGLLALTGHRPQDPLHWFYGPAVLVALPVALVLAPARGERTELLALGGGALAIALFGLRAVMTGG